jgi:raffinose/stachyose/melibiose transport system substrate-binding protein
LVAGLTFAVFALGVGASEAWPAGSDQLTISMLANGGVEAWPVMVANFERVYPNITVNVSYGGTLAAFEQTASTQLAAGNGPDLLSVYPGCGTPVSVCVLAKDGYLAPLVKEPWVKRSIKLVTSASKWGQGLFMFSPNVTFEGIFTNDTLFRTMGLQVPQTFTQLLSVCAKAKSAGTTPMLLAANGSGVIEQLASDIALSTVYANDPRWGQELRAGTVTFDDTPGWHQALQELVDMNDAGCFEPGPAALTTYAADAQFAQGQALMYTNLNSHAGVIAAADPQFAWSQHPFPSENNSARTVTLINLGSGPAVNARSSPASRAAAQTFIDFVARPKQNALFAQLAGGLTQYELLKGQLPTYLSSFAQVLASHRYGVNPVETWWNAAVGLALTTDGTGLLTGQTTIDQVLQAMDVAWKQGAS